MFSNNQYNTFVSSKKTFLNVFSYISCEERTIFDVIFSNGVLVVELRGEYILLYVNVCRW